MSEKKNLMINCEILDTRGMREEDYAQYEHITVNAEIVAVTPSSKQILARLPVEMNCEQTMELPEGREARFKTINGSHRIGPGSPMPDGDVILIVNGSLTVEPGAEELLRSYQAIIINGTVQMPQSMADALHNLKINGSAETYPDGYTVLKRRFVLDRFFPLQAREGGRYYAAKRIIVRSDVDADALVQKHVRFAAKSLVVPERLAQTLVPLFSEETEIMVVPEGFFLAEKSVALSSGFVRKNGKKLFVLGDLEIAAREDGAQLLAMLDALIVRGTVRIGEEARQAFEALDADYDELEIVRTGSRLLEGMVNVHLDAALLDASEGGVCVRNSAQVTLAPDITPAQILDKLTIRACAAVVCTEEQRSAVTAVAREVAQIGSAEGGMIGDMLGKVFGDLRGLADTKFINADSYCM